jgi:cysteinyl-tRNA synthetase
VLGLDLDRAAPSAALPAGAATLLREREEARAAKDFARSDLLRHQLGDLGVAVIDTADGQRWRVEKGGMRGRALPPGPPRGN